MYKSVPSGVELSICLFDDASSDGTAAAVRDQYPDVRIVEGDGNQFWCGGMRAAMSEAEKRKHDFLLWLNDDVELTDNAIATLLASHDLAKKEHGGSECYYWRDRRPNVWLTYVLRLPPNVADTPCQTRQSSAISE